MVHLAGVLLFTENSNLFLEIFKDPNLLVRGVFLPFMFEDSTSATVAIIRKENGSTPYRCSNCNLTFFVGGKGQGGKCSHPTEERKCPKCNASIGGNNSNPTTNTKAYKDFENLSGYIPVGFDDLFSEAYTARKINPFAFRVGHFLLHCTFLLSFFAGNMTLESIINQLKLKSRDDPIENCIYIIKHITNDWKILKNVFLKINDQSLLYILSEIINKFYQQTNKNEQKNLLCWKNTNLLNNNERENWEEYFMNCCCAEVEKNIQVCINKYESSNQQ